MKFVEPISITDNDILEVQVDDVDLVDNTPVWDDEVTYEPTDQVQMAEEVDEFIYECVAPAGSTGDNPLADDGSNWLRAGVKNRFRPFDKQLSPQLSGNAKIRYKLDFVNNLDPAGLYTVIFANVRSTNKVQVATRLISDGSVISNREIDTSGGDHKHYAVFENVYMDETMYLQIAVNSFGSDLVRCGEIIIGMPVELGEVSPGTETSILDFSTKDTDIFGNVSIVERAFVDTTKFRFTFLTSETRRIKYQLAQIRASPACFYISEGQEEKGVLVFGFYQDFRMVVNSVSSEGVIEVQGLT